MKVRILDIGLDTKSFVSVVYAWLAESKEVAGSIDVDETSAFTNVGRLAVMANSDVLVLLDDDEKTVVGFFGIALSRSKFSCQLIAEERYYYVIPEKRGRSSLRLLKAAEEWAKTKKCSHFLLYASRLAGDLHDRTCRLYEKLGMKQFETSYIKEL